MEREGTKEKDGRWKKGRKSSVDKAREHRLMITADPADGKRWEAGSQNKKGEGSSALRTDQCGRNNERCVQHLSRSTA